MFEVEVRGQLSEELYLETKTKLEEMSDSVEIDDRETVFFEIPDGTLKVSKKLSKNKALVAYKAGDISTSKAQKEYEIAVPLENADDWIAMYKALLPSLGHPNFQETSQERINYTIGSISFALKKSEDLGPHFEAEILVAAENEVNTAYEAISDFVANLGLKIMTAEEMQEVAEIAHQKHKNKRIENTLK